MTKTYRFIAVSVFFLIFVIWPSKASSIKAANVEAIKQQVKEVVEQRQNQGVSTASSATRVNEKTTQKNQTSLPKKPHVPVVKVLKAWWNGKIVLESRDGLWVLVIN